uniref:DNA-binding domain-containing protein n=1 Tax=Neglectibacter timonensis TaxID=1776382 RepID=UPI003AB38FD1
MAIELSTAEVASLKGCSTQYIRRLAKTEELKGHKCMNADGSPGWMFLVEELPTSLQEKYYNQLRASLPEKAKPKAAKPLDTYSIDEQEEIAFWLRLVKQWQDYRNKPGANKTEVDARFVQWCKLEYPERAISVDTLYRRWNAMRANDLDGLIDKRGKWKKGKSSIPDPMWQAFLYFFLDERQHPLKKCYEYTKLEMQTSFPELVGDMPSYTTFYRRAQADIPEPLKVLGREGEKAFRDRCAPYIRRVYDDMRSNEWWIADNHTFDIITEGENGQRHRLYLTAFFDARSGIFTGCFVTNAPSSQSTLIALRRGILKYGIPENIYVDNGREFLTYDVGGLGHRKKKPKGGQERFEPPPVFERLGIHMTNAIVRNAKAKIIERRFRDVKDHLSRLFDTFTGGNVLEKPESLKFILKDGRIPLDATLVETVEELLDWYFNQQPYGGAVARDHGKPRQQGL